jgi:uncharacterized protein YuzE
MRVAFAELGGAEQSRSVEAILDVTDFGDVAGIEILGLKSQAGPEVHVSQDDTLPAGIEKVSYDVAVDALYVRFAVRDPIRNQKGMTVDVLLDHENQLMGLDWNEAELKPG